MSESPLPAQRASDGDRERVVERLHAAATDGRITMEELAERLDDTYAAGTRDQLVPLTADLQGHDATPVPTGSQTFTVRPGENGARWLIAIMGACARKGRWRLGRRALSLNIMGASELDLNQVELGANHVELTVVSIMGAAEIRVPDGLHVEVSELALMGSNAVNVAEEHPDRSGPTLHLRLFSLMGAAEVKRGPKPTRAERKRQHRALGH